MSRYPASRIASKFSLGEIRHAAVSARDVFVDAFWSFQRNGDVNQAAAIAFYAILSAIPLFILTAVAISFFFGSEQSAHNEMTRMIREFHPYISEQFLAETGEIEEKWRVLGWVGLITLVWFSSLFFNAIETAFGLIFRSSAMRSYLKSKLLGFAMIPLGWTLGLASILFTYFVRLISENPWIAQGGWMADLLVHGFLFAYVIPYLIMVVFSTAIFKIIPTERLSMGNALAAGALFAALMEVAKHVFTWYLANYSRYNIIYGPLETLVIMVIWVFYVSFIMLFCAELVSSYRRRSLLLLEKAITGMAKGKVRSDIAARIFRRFGRFYPRGEYICREGEQGREIFYILMGDVQVEKKKGQTTKILAEMGPGDYFGEIAALADEPRSTSVRALTDCDIAVIDADTFRSLLNDYGDISIYVLKEMSLRIKDTTRRLEDLGHNWARLVTVLYLLKEWPFGSERDYEGELCRLSGLDVQDIRLSLAELGKMGILEFDGRTIKNFRDTEVLGILGADPVLHNN